MGNRIDEIDNYYNPVKYCTDLINILFWIITCATLLIYLLPISFFKKDIQTVYIIVVVIQFCLSQVIRFYLIPKAENARRKQFLSDSFKVELTNNKTNLYYNNTFPPSILRLGANTMENAFFSGAVCTEMLITKRLKTVSLCILWLVVIVIRQNNIELVIWISQIMFTGEIIAQWISLEYFNYKCDQVYDKLYTHFLHQIGQDDNTCVASLLDIFVTYESAKSSSGTLLSTKIFYGLNPTLSNKWELIKQGLKMN